jgi:hypothetical protein
LTFSGAAAADGDVKIGKGPMQTMGDIVKAEDPEFT